MHTYARARDPGDKWVFSETEVLIAKTGQNIVRAYSRESLEVKQQQGGCHNHPLYAAVHQ